MMHDAGRGEWHNLITSAVTGERDEVLASTHFIWTSLHDFGGSDSLRGNITQANEIPFGALDPEADSGIWGTGFTPEGIDQ